VQALFLLVALTLSTRHSREGGNLRFKRKTEIPAFAGMTVKKGTLSIEANYHGNVLSCNPARRIVL
jgi:hypothetical protein